MSRARIRLVNDDPTQIDLARLILRHEGYAVQAYESAADMLAGLSADPEVDLFVIDLHMPGIDGWKLCRLLRSPEFARYNETPVLVVSATFTGADVEAITSDLGANGFLTVPYERSELVHFVDQLLRGAHPRRRPRVLVVDDDDSVARAVRKAFERNGFDVDTAADVAGARSMAVTHRYDVVILDYHLDGESCEELVALFSDAESTAVTLVMTGDGDPSLPVRLLNRGADGYVQKPFDTEFLLELARKAQRERSLLRVEGVLERRTRELQASEQRYGDLYRIIPDLLLVVDEAGRIEDANDQAVRVLGSGAEGAVGSLLVDRVAPDHRPAFARYLARPGRTTFEASMLTTDGREVEVEFTAVATERDDRPVRLLVGRDLTERRTLEDERRRLEDQLHHAQRLDSLGVLAGGIAHDFNNLLVGMLGNATLALMDLPDDGAVRESVEQIEIAARRAAELTQQILVFSGKKKLDAERLDLTDLVSEMGRLMEPAVSTKARLDYRLRGDLAAALGDGSQLRQVVMNLIMNASDALQGERGTIRVTTGERELRPSDLAACVLGREAVPGPYVYVEVEDEGAGMDEATLHRIFEPFFTTRASGRGLGLAATLGIVRAHGGVLDVRSRRGVGTRFRVLLPVASDVEPYATETVAAIEADPEPDGGRVLVVDDEAGVRRMVRAVLSRAGFDVVEAADGAEALAVLNGRQLFDLVVLDVRMPGMDGFEVLEHLRGIAPTLPVVVSSGYSAEDLSPAHVSDPATTILPKPYAASELLEHVRSAVGRHRSAPVTT